RSYQASTRNLQPLEEHTVYPDEHCTSASRVTKGTQRDSNRNKNKTQKTSKAQGYYPSSPADGQALAYADGACSGNPGPSGLGAVLLIGDQQWELSEYLGKGTNNIAELTAILRVAEASVTHGMHLDLYTDSSYAIGVLSKGWKAKANQSLVAETRSAIQALKSVKLHHVRGHAGVLLNERADELARSAVETCSTKPWLCS
ncbi:MAG: RNase H family protein, partial [Myxococcota bacterium]